VYWFSQSVLRTIPANTTDAGTGIDLVTEDWPLSLTTTPDESALLWVQARNASGKPAQLYRLDGGPDAAPVSLGTTYHPMAIATDGTRAFWGSGGVQMTDLAALDGRLLVTGGQSARAMAVHGGAVYWANYGTGEIIKMAW
jgi:hypothetical protein